MTGCKNVLLVDTGADISIFKRSKIHNDQMVDISKKSKIKGVTEGTNNSLGVTETSIWVNGYNLKHTFYVVDANFPVPGDGILGRDFLLKYRATIDYSNWSMTVRAQNDKIFIPILSSAEEDTIHIPARCEVIRQVNSLKALSQDSVVINKELQPGIFVAKTIICKENPVVKIINTTLENVTLKNPCFDTISIDSFEVFNIHTETQNRNKQLLNELNTDIPDFVKHDLLSLCKEFSDVFALKPTD